MDDYVGISRDVPEDAVDPRGLEFAPTPQEAQAIVELLGWVYHGPDDTFGMGPAAGIFHVDADDEFIAAAARPGGENRRIMLDGVPWIVSLDMNPGLPEQLEGRLIDQAVRLHKASKDD